MICSWETAMTDDIIRCMGFLCLGSRFKRIGERMQADVARFIESEGLDLQPSQCPLIAALDRSGTMTVGELVEALGVSQPGVTRNVTRLSELGIVESARTQRDGRCTTVALTPTGRKLADRLKRETWPRIETAVAEVCAGLSGPLLKQLESIEDALADKPLDRRAAALRPGRRKR
jgi:DNA-binding MarR family transcriptional regulator